MIEYKDYESAKPRIEEAVMSLPDDPLLHHIRGDIIRHHIEKLKNEETVNMQEIVRLAIESSSCFQEVRERRPHMNHGYASDALVQITVMQASIKSVRSSIENYGFVEYLIEMINRAKDDKKLDEQEQYLLSVISSAYEYLNEGGIDYEYKDKLKRKFNECIPNIPEIKTLCEILQTEKKNFSGRKAWIDEVIKRTYSLFLVLEIENNKDMSPEDFELRIKAIEERGFNEDSMKYWFRHVRKTRSVPSLREVERKVQQWIGHSKRVNKISPHAEFYK
jgi:Fe-S cluster assembly iron-binding protein IscA